MLPVIVASIALSASERAEVLDRLPLDPETRHYPGLRAPLSPSPLQKLPTGAVRAQGWLKTQLDLQRKGFAGRLPEISKFLDPEDNAWMGTGKQDRAGWEELPYWLKGQVSLAYVTGDKALISQVRQWIEGVLKSQKPDGWFGPESNRQTRFGTPDLWPNMLMQSVLQTFYEATGDERVIPFLLRYADYLIALPDSQFLDPRHYWHSHRVGDQLATLVWLYDRTGETKLLQLAERIHRHGADWVSGIPNRHGVNFAQAFREPLTASLFSHQDPDRVATERRLQEFRDEFGQSPGGLYAADENARPGKTDPRQAAETCAIAEMMFSHELLLEFTADPAWADRAEDVAFNSLPAAFTADLKALRYLTSPNLAVSDAPSKSPGVENGGPMFLMDPNDHRCCQHNAGFAWPYFVEHLWMATDGGGLLAGIYSPSTATARVREGVFVTIREETDYPFEEEIRFRVEPKRPVQFPLSLRIPEWCAEARVSLNGRAVGLEPKPGQFVRLDRLWKSGDTVTLSLPMKIATRSWSQRPGALSVYRGPLAYSLKFDEEYRRVPRSNGWDAFEILPKSAWNYGLVPEPQFTFKSKPMPRSGQVWEAKRVPVSLTARAKRIPEWTLDMFGLVAPLQACPAHTAEPEEEIELIPMGAARLRITVFPTVSPNGTKWRATKSVRPAIPASYSHLNPGDRAEALSDGLLPQNSADDEIPRFTWWDHKGTEEWVQYTYPDARAFQSCRVYWYDDEPTQGFCRLPESWKLQAKVEGLWTDVAIHGAYPLKKDGWCEIAFDTVVASELRLVAKLREGYSAGILEWEFH